MSSRPDKVKSRRPANTAFKQQRLKAWQPILTPKTVLPAFFAVGAIFIPLGVGLFYASEQVNQLVFDYTNCAAAASTPVTSPVTNWAYDAATKTCAITFNVPNDFAAPVFLYYRLTNFYQNHRRYVKSFDAQQLQGNVLSTLGCGSLLSTVSNIDKETAVSYWPWLNGNIPSNAIVYPCGLIANSLFTDIISDLTPSNGAAKIHFTDKGIAWPTDSSKFVTPSANDLKAIANLNSQVLPPPLWVKSFPGYDGKPTSYDKGYTVDNFPDLGANERFQAWMRPAGLPNFRKIWGRLDNTLPAGTYTVNIVQNFDVTSYGGTKSIVISTVSILGGKNPFLGVAYMAVGGLCWILGIVFLLRHMIKPRKPGDYTYLSWNQPQSGAESAISAGVGAGSSASGR